MKHRINFLLFLIAIGMNSYALAQDSLKQLTLEHLIPGGSDYLYTDNVYGLDWWGDICIKPQFDKIVSINPKNNKETVIVNLDKVNSILSNYKLSTIPNLYTSQIAWPNKTQLLVTSESGLVAVDWVGNTAHLIHEISADMEHIDFNKKSMNIAYTIKNDLWVNNKQITVNPTGVVAGQSVHQNEFGISKGTFWSPNGDLLAFYNKDERMVTDYTHINIAERIAKPEPFKYPMAGMNSHKVEIGIYNSLTNKTIYLKTGDPTDRFFTNISWAPDQKSIYLIELNRDQNHAKLNQFDVASGELIQTLYEEKHTKYVEPQNPILFVPWNQDHFIYQSEKDGFNHLYLFNTKGQELRQLTTGSWEISSIIGFSAKTKEVLVTATMYSPLQKNIFAISLQTGKIRSLDNKKGVHNPNLNPAGTLIIDNYSSIETPRTIDIIDIVKNKKTTIFEASDPLKDYIQPSITVGTIKAADGETDLYYRLVQPKDIDTTKKHPVIVYVYGGPHAQMINHSWNYGVRGWDIYMANKGYLVFTLDNRGSDNRGLEFENCTFRELGIKEGEDQVEGLKFLSSLEYADMTRVGVHGWSFGGHMTTALMLRYPDKYKVGVAGGSVINWAYYEIMYGERYMDTPQRNPEGYKKTNLCNYADQLKGRLLMIHDGHDPVCVPQHTMSFIKACIDARTYPDLFIYPGHLHNVRGRDRVHLYEKVTRYFEEHL